MLLYHVCGLCQNLFFVYLLHKSILDSMVNVVGHKTGERALKLGELFLPAEALKIGLVDEVVADDAVLESARREVKKWLQVPGE